MQYMGICIPWFNSISQFISLQPDAKVKKAKKQYNHVYLEFNDDKLGERFTILEVKIARHVHAFESSKKQANFKNYIGFIY